jgi:hypothetical protein
MEEAIFRAVAEMMSSKSSGAPPRDEDVQVTTKHSCIALFILTVRKKLLLLAFPFLTFVVVVVLAGRRFFSIFTQC